MAVELQTQLFDSIAYDKRLTKAEVLRLIRVGTFPSGHFLFRDKEPGALYERKPIGLAASVFHPLGEEKHRKQVCEELFNEIVTRRALVQNSDGTYSRPKPSPTKVSFIFRGEWHTVPQSEYEAYAAKLKAENPTETQVIRRKVAQLEEELQTLKS